MGVPDTIKNSVISLAAFAGSERSFTVTNLGASRHCLAHIGMVFSSTQSGFHAASYTSWQPLFGADLAAGSYRSQFTVNRKRSINPTFKVTT